jgi:O-antigen ligase
MSAERQLKSRWYDTLCVLAFSAMISVPLFRPYFVDANRMSVIYAIFAAAGLAFVALAGRLYRANLGLVDYVLHVFFLVFIFAGALGGKVFPIDKAGLVGYLYASFVFGRWIGNCGQVRASVFAIGAIFLPVSLYVSYQLSMHDFSYSTYYRWSAAQLKLDYLEYALYAVVLFVFALESELKLRYKAIVIPFLFFVIMTSGARYSILFLLLVILSKAARIVLAGRAIERVLLILVLCVVALSIVVPGGRIGGDLDPLAYTTTRLSSMVNNDASIDARIKTLNKTINAIGDRAAFGYGLGQGAPSVGINYPHNIVLEVALDGGVIPAFLLAIALGVAAMSAVRNMSQNEVAIGVVTLFAIGAYLKSFSFYESRLLFFFMGISVGVFAARANGGRHTVRLWREARPKEKPTRRISENII